MATPCAAYAVIEDGRIELKRVPYPIEETVAAIHSSPWPDRAKDMLTHVVRHGRLPRTDGIAGSQATADAESKPETDPDD